MSTEISANHFATEDEISLIDLIRVVRRHMLLLFGAFALSLALTIVMVFLYQPRYLYSATIEIGSITDQNGRSNPVESANAAKAKLDEGYIPSAIAEHAGNSGKSYAITVRSPRNSDLLILDGKATKADAQIIVAIENSVIAKLKEEHARLFDMEKVRIGDELANEERRLEGQLTLQKNLTASRQRNTKLEELRKQELADAKARLAVLLSNRQKADKASHGDAANMALLLLDAEIEKARRLTLELEQAVNVDLPAANDSLELQLAEAMREQVAIEAKVKQIKLALENIRETRAIKEPSGVGTPTGMSKKAIIAVGIMLGAILAVLAVFIAEFVARARVELREEASGQ